jgi:hypothetical protein
LHTTIDLIESDFCARRSRPPDVAAAFALAFAPIEAGAPGDACLAHLSAMGRAVAVAIDALANGRTEPAYHNRHHMAETTLAMGMLCRLALEQGLISRSEAAIGVVAMAAHDMGHDGSMPAAGVLERRARDAAAPLAAQAGVGAAAFQALGDVIMATDATQYAQNAGRLAGRLPPGPMGRGQDALRALANEADICGSLLPRLGPVLSRALAAEWRACGNAALDEAGTASSRLAFLQRCPPLSGPAVALGLDQARRRCFDVWTLAGQALGAEATPEAGCAALDRLDPAVAAALYEQIAG